MQVGRKLRFRMQICRKLRFSTCASTNAIDSNSAFFSSQEGAAAMEAPQDDENGRLAVAIMAKVNKESSEDMITLVSEVYGQVLEGQTIVELGPGSGYATRCIIKKKPARLLAYEISPVFRKLLSEHDVLVPAIESGVLSINSDDAMSMPDIAPASVDVIVGMNVVYFLNPLASYLTEFLRVLKPGGWVIFGTKMNAIKSASASKFVNRDANEVASKMDAAGFQDAAVAPARLLSDPPTPAMYIPIVCQKPL